MNSYSHLFTSMTIFPHLTKSPVLACFGISDTPKLHSAIKAVKKKYPDITLACFDSECYKVAYGMHAADVLFSPFMQSYVIEKYNVIGALVGMDYQGDTYGLKEMRI